MQTISGYELTEQLHESMTSLVYRGQRLSDSQPVVLKMLKDAYPSPERIARFQREFAMTSSLDLPGVVQAFDLHTSQPYWVMALEDFGGDSLAYLKLAGQLPLDEGLALASAVADTLAHLHQIGIIHKDINPSNIVYNQETGQVKLIDFGISTMLSRENPGFRNPDMLEGTLNYMSPEQTGRMNRSLDYRSDLYSLGVTLYELFTGQLPFRSNDALEIVHSHIARQPPPPRSRLPDMPPMLDALISKLLAKNPEDRYQSAYGLRVDLDLIRSRLHQSPDAIAPLPPAEPGGAPLRPAEAFVLGQHDIAERLLIPQKLYGREQEIAQLLAAFEELSEQRSKLLLIAGTPGVGKSVLVQELHKPITRQRGTFVGGKFDQLQRATPYAGFIQAFQALVRQVLTESDIVLAGWRNRLQVALGSNTQVIVALIPDVALITGPVPPPPPLGAAEARNRLHLAFQNFVQVFARPEHPLVLFLDDLQWADSASLVLLEHLLSTAARSSQPHALLVIGTYRSNEVDANHPLRQMQQAVQAAGLWVQDMALEPLSSTNVQQLIAETLRRPPDEVATLAELVTGKTGGNPFFVNEFLQMLVARGLLSFSHPDGRWQWDARQIHAQGITDNVADLLTERLRHLHETTRSLLYRAACIGHQFSLTTLAAIATPDNSPRQTAAALEPALREGLIVPLSEHYTLMTLDVPGLTEALTADYAFAHDRIQQAVYALIDPAAQQALHWQIGHLLLGEAGGTDDTLRLPADEPDENGLLVPPPVEEQIFAIVSHLNRGQPADPADDVRLRLAVLNLVAGRRAQQAAAYHAAYAYLSNGVQQLAADDWQQHYGLALELYSRLAATAYLTGDTDMLAHCTSTVLAHARTTLDTIAVYETNIQARAAQREFLAAIEMVLPVLEALGVSLPAEPAPDDTGQRMQAIQQALASTPLEQVPNLPPMTDPADLAAMRVLAGLFSLAYIGAPALMPLVVAEQVLLSLHKGHADPSPFAYANYGLILCAMGDSAQGTRYGELALRLLDMLEARAFRAKTLVIVSFFVLHWNSHARSTLEPLLEGYRSGLDTGDFEYAGYAAYMHTCHSFLLGSELNTLHDAFASNDETFARLHQERTRQQNGLYWQVVTNLLEDGENPCHISGDYYDETSALPQLAESNDIPSLGNVAFNKLFLTYLFQRYDQAVKHAEQLESYLAGLTGSLLVPLFTFYDSLARLAALEMQPLDEHGQARPEEPLPAGLADRISANQQQLQHWAESAPDNYRHKWYLVEAERARLEGRDGAAWEYYDQAITLAHEQRFLHEEALAYELAGRFYLAKERPKIARVYLHDAYYLYQRWGAHRKAKDLEVRYGWLLEPAEPRLLDDNKTLNITNTGQNTSQLDIHSVFKAYQSISGEIVLETLLAKLMHTVIENAGAERGLLVLERAGAWVVEAEGSIGSETIRVLQALPLSRASLPQTIVNYVARTRESIVLTNASEDERFHHDAYIDQHQPRSILCTPLLNKGMLIGMLYLENNQASGAFSAERLEVLNLLSGQVAISIENANLYANLEELVAARTVELSAAYQTVKTLNEHLEDELTLARRIQHSLLPPASPAWSALDVVCYTVPARQVGGDLYDYHALANQHYVMAVGDVSGKGMPAALLMAVSVALFRATVQQAQPPAAFLATMDMALTDYTRSTRQNCAFVYVALEPWPATASSRKPTKQWRLQIANAGCIAPLLKRADGSFAWVDVGGVPLGTGLGAAHGYQAVQLAMSPGDILILTSDGIVEATDGNGEFFGFERLEQAVLAGPQSSAEAMLHYLRATVQAFTGDTEAHDDITILVIRV